METEVRFSVDRKNQRQVKKWLSGHDKETQSSETVYFDTAQNALRNVGVELRLRRNHKGIKQTIKSVGPEGSLFSRAESEIEISDFQPQLEHLKKALPKKARKQIDFEALRPAFSTHINRIIINTPSKNGMVESVFDSGQIETGSRTLAISEVEHELKDGTADALVSSCHDFLDQVTCSIGLEGKAARGYRLATGIIPEPVFASKMTLPPETPIPDTIRRILQGSFQHAMANLPVYIVTGDEESIHQFRVGLRRFRAALSAFSPVMDLTGVDDLIRQTRTIFDQMGHIRDADVFLDETLEALVNSGIPGGYGELLRTQVSHFRQTNYDQVKDVLQSNDFARYIVDINAWVDSGDWLKADRPVDQLLQYRPVSSFAESRLQKMNRKLVRLGQQAEQGSLDDWHRLRIMTKKVRYASEPLLQLIGEEEGARYAKSLSSLQNTLGKLNDLNSISGFLGSVEKTLAGASRPAFQEATAYCIGWGSARADAAVNNLLPSWRAFSEKTGKMWG